MSSGFTCNYNKETPNTDWNDIYLDSSGNIATSTGDAYTEENCYHAFWMLLGEYVFDSTIGIDWSTFLSSSEPIISNLKLSIRNNLLTIDGVESVNNIFFSLDRFNRVMNITVNITLSSGITTDINFEREL